MWFKRKTDPAEEKKDGAAATSSTQPETTTTTGIMYSTTDQPTVLEGVNEKGETQAMGEPLGQTDTTATTDHVYPSGLRLFALMASVFISLFLVALVRTSYFPYSSIKASTHK